MPLNKSKTSIGKIVRTYDNDWYLIGTLDYCLKVQIKFETGVSKINLLGCRIII